MEKINIAELLKDCPKGMELDCTMFDDVTLLEVIDRPNNRFPIKIAIGANRFRYLTETGGYDLIPETKCVIFPKGKTTWEGFQRPFKDGDIVALDTEESTQLFIFKEYIYNHDYVQCYMMLDYDGEIDFEIGDYYVERFATEEEKTRLFQAIKDNGYHWNDKLKILEKLVESRFHEGDWVVNRFGDVWHIDSFDSKNYQVSNGKGNYNYFPISEQDKMHLWTISDAKCGDVVCYKDEISLYKHDIKNCTKREQTFGGFVYHCGYDGKRFITDSLYSLTEQDKMNIHPATKEHCDLLYQKIKENGYEWNFETKTLEKVIKPEFKVGDIIQDLDSYKVTITKVHIEEEYYEYESVIAKGIGSIRFLEQSTWELVPNKFDITTLKPFDKVLVRQNITGKWGIDFFGSYNEGYYHATGGCAYRYCIPYEGNEHLLGKTDDCKDFYKTW